MKTISRILIILNFAAIIFLPDKFPSRWCFLPLFAVMAGCVALYWFSMFWVSRKDVVRVSGMEPDFDVFAGRIPSDPQADLTRGRLCVMDGRLILFQRTDDKIHKTEPCREVWSIPTSQISSLGFGKVLSVRKGLVIYLNDDEVSFTCGSIDKNRESLYRALGWKMEDKT